jgi:5-methylcytosine-specific restriction endonuclease McrA
VLREEPTCSVPGCERSATQVDHVIPLSKAPGLALERSNLRGICASHNASKGDRSDVDQGGYYCPHPLCTYPETCGGPDSRWHL